jgi:hypothetical protein
MQSVVDVLVGQIKRDDFAAVGVDANMEFATPLTTTVMTALGIKLERHDRPP